MQRKVVVTGAGIVCPLGSNLAVTWSRLIAGDVAVCRGIFTNAATGTQLSAPIARLPEGALSPPPKAVAGLIDRFTQMALQAASAALEHSCLTISAADRTRIGVANGTCMGGISETEAGFDSIYVRKRARVHPFTVIRTMYNAPAAFISAQLDISGPVLAYSTTCSSSAVAIGEASRIIRHGYADVMIAGGSESLLTYSAINCWNSAQLLAPVADPPSNSCRPFAADRAGTSLGEGAAFVVLESLDHAINRGAPILAELAGYGCTADSGHVTQPSVQGQGAPMRAALSDANMDATEIGYVHAHGTGTKANDATETAAIKSVFGAAVRGLAVSSSKAQIGHLVGAAGAVGLVLGLQAIRSQVIPPTVNLTHADPECDLDYVPGLGRKTNDLRAAMCNAFGFGGTATSLVVRALP